MKKHLALLLSAALALSLFAACALTEEAPAANDAQTEETSAPAAETDAQAPETADGELDLSAVAVEVGDIEITLGEVKNAYDSYVAYFTGYGYDVSGDVEFLTSVVETLAQEKLMILKAEELGFQNLNEEQQAELDSRVDAELTSLRDYFTAEAEIEAEADPTVDVAARTEEMILEEAVTILGDPDATYEDYVAYITETLRSLYLQELLEEELLKDVAVPNEAVRAEYDALAEEQLAYYTEAPEAYKFDQEAYEMSGTAPVVYAPEGYSRILHLFVPFEDVLPDDYEANEADMDLIRKEYGTLAIDAQLGTAQGDAKSEMEALLAQYAELKNANEAMYETHTAAAREEAKALYEELEAGADFASLIKEKGGDDGYRSFEVYTEKGILIAAELDCDDDWSDPVKAYFAELAMGEYSEPFADHEGYHIIFYLADEPAGNVPYEAVAEDIRAYLLEDQRFTEWDAIVSAWMTDGTVKYHPAVYEPLA